MHAPKYKILKKLTIEEGLQLIEPTGNTNIYKEIDGFKIKVNNAKLRTYLFKGCYCYKCNKPAVFFAIVEQAGQKDNYFLELFRYTNTNNLMPFTRDHIIPKSRINKEAFGRKNAINNLQPMCYSCNQEKDNKILWERDKI